jgi:hypothetical protein
MSSLSWLGGVSINLIDVLALLIANFFQDCALRSLLGASESDLCRFFFWRGGFAKILACFYNQRVFFFFFFFFFFCFVTFLSVPFF